MNAGDLVDQCADAVSLRDFLHHKGSGRHVAVGKTAGTVGKKRGGDVIVLLLFEHLILDDRSGRDDPDHVALHQTLGKRGILHLLADGHLVPFRDQAGNVRIDRVKRHAAHGRALGKPAVSSRQGQIEFL